MKGKQKEKFKKTVRVWNVSYKSGESVRVATVEHHTESQPGCSGCHAPCCRGAISPVLNQEEFLSKAHPMEFVKPERWFRKHVPRGARHRIEKIAVLKVNDDACVYFDKETCLCTNWENRPASCRSYDCREDDRPGIRWVPRVEKGA